MIWIPLLTLTTLAGIQGEGITIAHRDKWTVQIERWEGEVGDLPTIRSVDTATMIVKEDTGTPAELFMIHNQCDKCPLKKEDNVAGNDSFSLLIQTKYSNTLEIRRDTYDVCGGQIHLIDKGLYWLIIYDESGNTKCDLVLWNKPENIYLPILWAFLVFLGLAILWVAFKQLYTRRVFDKCRCHYSSRDFADLGHSSKANGTTESTTALEMSSHINGYGTSNGNGSGVGKDQEATPPFPPVRAKERLRSLDAFRGLCLTVMIFVNYGYCCNYFFFQHAPWNGLLVADLVFPWFIWIMGTSMAFSFKSIAKRNKPAGKVIWKIIFRAIKLFLLGIFLATQSNNDMRIVRIPGVLQRFSLTYLFVAFIHFPFAKLAHKEQPYHSCRGCGPLKDICWYWPEWIIQMGILGAHVGLTFGLDIPGCPKGYLGPGGWHDGGKYFNCTGGAAGYIDRMIMPNHLYGWGDHKSLYGSKQDFDPEGILGTLTSIFQCFIGLQAGKIIMTFTSHKDRLIRWLIWAVVTGGIGTLLCKASVNDGWIPLNKNLWSISFVLVLSGLAFILLIIMYLVIDVWKIWTGAPFVYPGMNSIVIYVCHAAFGHYFPITWAMPDPSVHWQTLLTSLWGTTFWVIVAYIMFRKKFFVAL